MKYRIFIEQDEDGVFVAEVSSLPGCISQGKTRAEAVENIKEAISGYIESLEKHGDPVPPPITEEIIKIRYFEKVGHTEDYQTESYIQATLKT